MTDDIPPHLLDQLLKFLALARPQNALEWHEWHVTPVPGGANNLLYRIDRGAQKLAVKFSRRDKRKRARREAQALNALQSTQPPLAPRLLHYGHIMVDLDVTVQSWTPGEVSGQPPQKEEDWRALVAHYAALHSISHQQLPGTFLNAVLNADSHVGAKQLVFTQLSLIPTEAQPDTLRASIKKLDRRKAVVWPKPPKRFLRNDPNLLNFIRLPDGWISVDWENSGWGDPAFEIADLLAHPCYMSIPEQRRKWIVETYISFMEDEQAAERIQTYYEVLLTWWLTRLARMLYEVPRGLDQRLIERPAEWQVDIKARYEIYWGCLQNLEKGS